MPGTVQNTGNIINECTRVALRGSRKQLTYTAITGQAVSLNNSHFEHISECDCICS